MNNEHAHSSKTAIIKSTIAGKAASIVGYSLTILILLAILGGACEDVETTIFILVFLAGSVALIVKGIQIKNRIRRFKKYVSIISLEGDTSLESMASKTSKSIDFITKDLQKMMDKKFFVNAFIDKETGEIILQNRTASASSEAEVTYTSSKTTVVTCKNCGASNSIRNGASAECEFCGSPLR